MLADKLRLTKPPIEFRSDTVTQLSSNASSIDLTIPAGYQEGDLLIAYVGTGATGPCNYTFPGGWNALTAYTTNGPALALVWKYASSSEATFTVSASNSNKHGGGVLCYKNAAYDANGGITYSGSGGALSAPAVTITHNRSVALVFFMANTGSTTFSSVSPLPSVIHRENTGSDAPSWYVGEYQRSAGSFGAVTGALSTGAQKCSLLISLKQK